MNTARTQSLIILINRALIHSGLEKICHVAAQRRLYEKVNFIMWRVA